MEFVKVIIVGGGAAGLGAAKTLGSKVDYLLIEAQDYLGGRILTVDAAPNVVVDLGAQFIHGETKNIVYEICQQLNCILPDRITANNDTLVLTTNRTKIDSEIMNKAIGVWDEILDEAAEKFGDDSIPTHYPFSDYVLQYFKERLLSALPSSTENSIDAIVDYFNKSELIENGCLALSELSLSEYGSFENLDGTYEYQLKNGGYRPLIAYLKSFIPDDHRVRLNSEVIRVKYLKDDQQLLVQIRHHDKNSEEQISTIRCEHMIWTSSLGYLKENFSSIFADEIELIEQKKNAIDNLGFDTVNKVVMIYEQRFWPENISEIMLLHIEKQRTVELSNLLKDIFKDEKIDIEVIRTIIEGLYRYDVLPSTDIPVLLTWFGGPAALLFEDLSEQVISQICHVVVCYSLNIPWESNQPIRVLKSEWHKNPFIRGSYSYYSIKSPAKDGEILRTAYSPDGIPRIQFAGEATHEKFYSTVHGALESGIRESDKLLSIINQ